MSATLLTAEEEKALYEALGRDPDFWTAFVKDPKAAYKAKFDRELLPGQELLVEQEGPNRVSLVSPATGLRMPVEYRASGELSDEQLDTVAAALGMPPSAPVVTLPVSAVTPIPMGSNDVGLGLIPGSSDRPH